MKVLVIEGDEETGAHIAGSLREQGYVVELANTSEDGLFLGRGGGHDVFIVDRMLPGLDGFSLVHALRQSGVTAPVLFLTALGGIGDRVRGLEAGGDDYLAKPFTLFELLARINALARRRLLSDAPTTLRIADLELDLLKRMVRRSGKVVELQASEFRLLEFLMRNAGRTVTRSMLLEAVWAFHFNPKTNIVQAHVSRLRSKLSQYGRPELIHGVHPAGYVLLAGSADEP